MRITLSRSDFEKMYAYAKKERPDEACGLILMDELGFLEAGAAGFRKAVLDVLAGPKPVLGVVRQGLGAWQDAPLGELWEVTEENRDAVPDRLRRRLAALLPAAFL